MPEGVEPYKRPYRVRPLNSAEWTPFDRLAARVGLPTQPVIDWAETYVLTLDAYKAAREHGIPFDLLPKLSAGAPVKKLLDQRVQSLRHIPELLTLEAIKGMILANHKVSSTKAQDLISLVTQGVDTRTMLEALIEKAKGLHPDA